MSGWDLETQREIPWNGWPRNGSKLNGLAQGKRLIAGNHVFFSQTNIGILSGFLNVPTNSVAGFRDMDVPSARKLKT